MSTYGSEYPQQQDRKGRRSDSAPTALEILHKGIDAISILAQTLTSGCSHETVGYV